MLAGISGLTSLGLHAPEKPPWEGSSLSRRATLRHTTAAVAAVAACVTPAIAEYGEGARQAPPALVPSPFYPTGKMAETCEVVALGREDVCLKPKKLLTAYEAMQHAGPSEARTSLASSGPNACTNKRAHRGLMTAFPCHAGCRMRSTAWRAQTPQRLPPRSGCSSGALNLRTGPA